MTRPLTLALLLATISSVAVAQPALPTAPVAKPQVAAPTVAQKQARIEVGEGGSTIANYDTGVSEMNGDITITQDGEDFILYAQKVIHSDRKNQATATSSLRVETRDSTIKAVKMFADFNTKIISMLDSVVISSYGEGDGIQTDGQIVERAKKKRKPVRIACDRLDWNYDTQQATLVGNIRIVQGDSVGTCNQIIYDEAKNAARLLGDVNFGNAQRRQFLTDELTLFVDSGLTQTNAAVNLLGPVTNVADGAAKPATKPTEAFPEPAQIGDANTFPAPPADIEKFLPKAGAPIAPGKAAKKPAPAAPAVKAPVEPAAQMESEVEAPTAQLEPEAKAPEAPEIVEE